jgi:hypothetical protein
MIWDTDGLLPKNLIAVLPTARQAFVDRAEIIVTHGGITIDEVVVPLIEVRMNER